MGDYETERNKLIPLAEERANRLVGKIKGDGTKTDKAARWTKEFASGMDELSLESGLTPWLEGAPSLEDHIDQVAMGIMGRMPGATDDRKIESMRGLKDYMGRCVNRYINQLKRHKAGE